MKTGGAIALSASLATLASLGTYVVMKGKNKEIANLAKKSNDFLQERIKKLETKLNSAKGDIENLKREIRFKEDLIEKQKGDSIKTSDKLLATLKELGSLKRELKTKDEQIKKLQREIEVFGKK